MVIQSQFDSGIIDHVVEEEDREWIRFLGGNSSSGIEKYRGLNSSDGGNIGDGVKIAGGVIGFDDEIEFIRRVKITATFLKLELFDRPKYSLRIFIEKSNLDIESISDWEEPIIVLRTNLIWHGDFAGCEKKECGYV
ncbi:hypothetical protein Tco_0501930 [Tanacetum coccineum]